MHLEFRLTQSSKGSQRTTVSTCRAGAGFEYVLFHKQKATVVSVISIRFKPEGLAKL